MFLVKARLLCVETLLDHSDSIEISSSSARTNN